MLIQKIRELSAEMTTKLKNELVSFESIAAVGIDGIRRGNDRFIGLGSSEQYILIWIESWMILNDL